MRLFLLAVTILSVSANLGLAQDWREEKGKHFIIKYSSASDSVWAKRVLRSAENYYSDIADKIGFSRYYDFWTWDNRVEIFIFPDQDAFLQATGLPAWSNGGAVISHHERSARRIVSFQQEDNFLDGVLPHEISHLILRDYFGHEYVIPVWFDEGVAQLSEKGKSLLADRVMRNVLGQGAFIPFRSLMNFDIRQESDQLKAAVYYSQCLSMIEFLINRYGSNKFSQLCAAMRGGKNFEQALMSSYVSIFDSIEEFQEKWLSSMSY